MVDTDAKSEETGSEVLDPSRLAVLREVDGDDGRPFIYEFARHFKVDADKRLKELSKVVMGDDLAGLRNMAHAFKGSCMNLGAMQMAAACRELESKGDACTSNEAGLLVDRIGEEYKLVEAALQALDAEG